MKNILIKLAAVVALGIVIYGVTHAGPDIPWSQRPLWEQSHPEGLR